MSLIIKGSIMPLMCGDCPCYDGSDYACNATGRGVIEYRYDGRPDNCPIVEIPTPHGRLIDAEKLAVKIWTEGHFVNGNDCEIAVDFTQSAPTVIEAEVSE